VSARAPIFLKHTRKREQLVAIKMREREREA
jgi:hypothetical protein